MAVTAARPELHVEGNDDQHSVVHLLIRHGVKYHPDDFRKSPIELPKVVAANGIELCLRSLRRL